MDDLDRHRIRLQLDRVRAVMKDGGWRTLWEIQARTPLDWVQSISARLRDFRKERFGGHTVRRRLREAPGLFEYQLILRTPKK